MLDKLNLSLTYRSDRDDLLSDFYLPCLSEAVEYSRAVGYFTSESLSLAARGLSRFISKRGRVRLIASPVLSKEDAQAIESGYRSRDDIIASALVDGLARPVPPDATKRLEFLAWMISEDLLDIQIAIVEDAAGFGIYHEKIGIFSDEAGNRVAFTGSANESYGGLVANFESIDVFRSWVESDAGRVIQKCEDFEALWMNATTKLTVLAFPEAAKQALLKFRPDTIPTTEPGFANGRFPEDDKPAGLPIIPTSIVIRPYQRDAVRSWFENNGHGLWKMATGTGKTITAFALVTQLCRFLNDHDRPLIVVVVCPYQHLVSQWAEEAVRFGIDPVLCYQSHTTWLDQLINQIIGCDHGNTSFLMAIATNATFIGDRFQEAISRIRADFLFIADEAHNVGAENLRTKLPAAATYRLGLSATPERWYDDAGTKALFDYFGRKVYELDLGDAIKMGALTKYDYFPTIVELQEDELQEYIELTTQIVRLVAGQGDVDLDVDSSDERLKKLLIRRARLTASARGKIDALRDAVTPLRDSAHNLFYCGDGTMDYGPLGPGVRQIDAVTHLLGRELGMAVNTYTAETYLDERSELREDFARGRLNGLVAIRCLDEGVDIPETRRAFILASSTNPRQFVQRRGRILRRSPGKDKAEIYDFIVIPPAKHMSEALFNMERRLVRRELQRVVLFASLAENGTIALHSLLDLRKQYNLLDLG